MAAFVIVTSLLELVEQQLLQSNPHLIPNGRETIVKLSDKLHFLQDFLEEYDMKINYLMAKEMLETEIKDVATKAKAFLEEYDMKTNNLKVKEMLEAGIIGLATKAEAFVEEYDMKINYLKAKEILGTEMFLEDYDMKLNFLKAKSMFVSEIQKEIDMKINYLKAKEMLEKEIIVEECDMETNFLKAKSMLAIEIEKEFGIKNIMYLKAKEMFVIEIKDVATKAQDFVEEYDMKINNFKSKEMLETDIKDVAIKAEGKIGPKLRQVYLAVNRGKFVVEACQELYQTLEKLLNDIEQIEVRILNHKTDTTSLFGSTTNYFKEGNIVVTGHSRNALEPEDEIIVGFDTEIKAITDKLVDRRSSLDLKLIPIVGMGGQGKTTLVKKVYQHRKVMDSFQIRAWAVVSQECHVKELLINLLSCVIPVTNQMTNQDEAELAKQLRISLTGQRYLVVLDDIWTYEVWDAIRGYFPDNSNGSRILITTRNLGVAEYLWITTAWNAIQLWFPKSIHRIGRVIRCPPNNDRDDCPKLIIPFGFESKVSTLYYSDLFIIKFLSNAESWKLFAMKVFKHRNSFPFEFHTVGRHIASQCNGLPMAVALIGRLLATVKEKLQLWIHFGCILEKMYKSEEKISKILSWCYNYLPNHLKTCFLYFAVFREDNSISIKKLIKLWVAEGFIKRENSKSLEEVAKSYLYDLINRNLVQIDKRSVDGKIKSCKIHDRVLEVCVREAKKENLMCLIGKTHAPEANRWISCQSSHWPITQISYGNHTSNEICSILYFGQDFYLSKCRLVYHCLELLRVLDLSSLKYSHSMPSGIADLIHLRFLTLSTIGSLYQFRFFKLQNLQTLMIFSWMQGCHLQLPCDILNLPQLRHLHLEKRSSQYLPRSVKKDLQTLFWLKVASLDQKPNFGMVPNLKELGIYIEGELAPNCLESLFHLCLLEKLKFEMGRAERFYLPTSIPLNLKKLTLRCTYLPWKEMDIISKLPNLEVLKLKDFAFCGPEWRPKKGGFRRLNVLLITYSNLKRWSANCDHFPILERLVLRYCLDLKHIPYGFATIETLKYIVLDSCYSSLVESAYDIYWMVAPRTFFVHDLGTKVELQNNDHSEDESVEYVYSEEESVELPSNNRFEEESVELPISNCFVEESVELQSNGSSKDEIDELPKKVLTAIKKKVLSMKKKVLMNCQRGSV